jgi:hypothetical protein
MSGTFKTARSMALIMRRWQRIGHGLAGAGHEPRRHSRYRRGDPTGDAAYDELRSGYNIAVEHQPEEIIDAVSPADVVTAVRLAAGAARPTDFARPRRIKTVHDPHNMFRINFKIPPERNSR